MGYKGDAQKSKFTENKIQEIRPPRLSRYSRLASTKRLLLPKNTQSKNYFVSGGKHVTSNNMFKVAEINRRTAEAAEMENGKKSRVECHLRRKAALPIFEHLVNELEKNVGQQRSKELEMLLW
jgi:hypothetical protein